MNDLLKMVYSMKKLYDHLCLEVLQKYNITRNELDILLFLYNNPELDSAKDIVEKRGIVKSHASLGIEKLIKKDYIESIQDHQDRRQYHLYIKEPAMIIIQDGMKVRKQFNKTLMKDFTANEVEIFQKMMNRIYQNVCQEEER